MYIIYCYIIYAHYVIIYVYCIITYIDVFTLAIFQWNERKYHLLLSNIFRGALIVFSYGGASQLGPGHVGGPNENFCLGRSPCRIGGMVWVLKESATRLFWGVFLNKRITFEYNGMCEKNNRLSKFSSKKSSERRFCNLWILRWAWTRFRFKRASRCRTEVNGHICRDQSPGRDVLWIPLTPTHERSGTNPWQLPTHPLNDSPKKIYRETTWQVILDTDSWQLRGLENFGRSRNLDNFQMGKLHGKIQDSFGWRKIPDYFPEETLAKGEVLFYDNNVSFSGFRYWLRIEVL